MGEKPNEATGRLLDEVDQRQSGSASHLEAGEGIFNAYPIRRNQGC